MEMVLDDGDINLLVFKLRNKDIVYTVIKQ